MRPPASGDPCLRGREAGTALLAPMRAMGMWAVRYGDAVIDAQDRFEARGRAQ
ncbi:hypothetical protein [Microbispora sp. NPDC046933]|uniref:hypothetical protein n=1 Tax=Microbispora sp. NPDC046933 TaxID=3155618 RepID=UPI003403CBC1